MVAKLDDSDFDVRGDALQTLVKLEPFFFAQHADALVSRLDDSDRTVRSRAAQALRMLDPATIAPHVVESLGRIV